MSVLTSSLLSFSVVALAEIGDKSQLVCMALAAKHRTRPVLLGAVSAFLVLNLLAVTVGAALASWLPMQAIAGCAALMFGLFGVQSLRHAGEEDDENTEALASAKSGRGILLTTFMMIFVAELGDKTQLAVAGMSTTELPLGVWLGASLALAMTSALGVFAGRHLLTKINPVWLHRCSGVFFLLLAALAGIKAIAA